MSTEIEKLETLLGKESRAAVALSGGLDSSALLALCAEILGAQNCLALTAQAPYTPRAEAEKADSLCRRLGVKREILRFEILPEIKFNPPDRCYICKKKIFSEVTRRAAGLGFPSVFDGSNADDLSDHRPGMKALKELGVRSPFLEAGIGKAQIAQIAQRFGIEVVPPCACLLTRLERGAQALPETLEKIDEAENFLRALGFAACRVRVHGECARIEIDPALFDKFCDKKIFSDVRAKLRELGFKHSALDLAGYARGSMNK